MSHINSEPQKFSQMLYECLKSKDCEERIDPDKLTQFKTQHIDSLYPQREQGTCFELCTYPGSFCCGFTAGDDSFKKLGLSICLYFNFLKHSCFYLFIVSTLSILSCVVCYFVAMQNGINTMDHYSKFLFSTTYGSFATQHNKCKYSLINSKNATYSSSFNIKCDTGRINLFGPTLSTQSLNSLYNCKNQKRKWSSNADNLSSYVLNNSINCNQADSECNISMIFKSNFTKNDYKTIAYAYECLSSSYKIGQLYGKSEHYFLFVFLVDVFIFTFFIVFLISEVFNEKKAKKYFELQVQTSDYSIQIKGFTTKSAESELQTLLSKIEKSTKIDIASIVTYTIQQNQKMYQLYRKKQKAYRAASDLIEIYCNYDEMNKFQSFRECFDNVFDQNDQKKAQRYRQYSQQLSIIMNEIVSIDRILMRNEISSDEQVSCFLIFQTINSVSSFKKIMEDNNYRRCCSNKLQINGKVYQIDSAPVPDIILRGNCYNWTKLRVFISWILAIVIIVGSYLIFGFILYKQAEMNSTHNFDIDCNILYSSGQLATINSSLLSQANYLSCICKNQNLRDLYQQTSNYCSIWQTKNFIYENIQIFISLGIVVYNILASFLFQLLSKFERHKTIVNQQVSYTFKRAFQLIANMGLIVILLNFNIKNQNYLNQMSFIYLGRFDDFALYSYENISTIVILTMIFNIATPFAQFLMTLIKKGFKICFDTRCGCFATSKKTKDEYLEYFNDNIFRIQQRYAYLIATFFITFSFCGVLPILIPILTISLIFLYCLDKILIFKFYQIPKIYTQTLHKIFITTLKISVLAHLSLTVYFLSQPSLMPQNSRVTSYKVSDNTRINNIITLGWMYFYLGLLVLAFIIQTLISCCEKDDVVTNQPNFWGTLSRTKVNDMLKVLTYTKERFIRKTYGYSESPFRNPRNIRQRTVPKCQQILKNAIKKLKSIQMEHNNLGMIERAKLKSLPSYDYTMRSDRIARNMLMMKVENKFFALGELQRGEIQGQANNRSSDRLNLQ